MSYYNWTPEQLELGVRAGEIWYAKMISFDPRFNNYEQMLEMQEASNELTN